MVKPGAKTKGRQRLPNRLIEGKEQRQVTLSKRKSGIFKKASEISVRCGAHVAVVTFSEVGKVFAFGSPSVDAVLRRYVPGSSGDAPASSATDDADLQMHRETLEALCQAVEQKAKEVKAEAARMKAVGDKVLEVKKQAGARFWWEVEVEALGEAELPEFARALQRLRANVLCRAEKLSSALATPQDGDVRGGAEETK